MLNFRQVEGITPAERDDLDQLQRTLYANGRIRREQADILVELHGRMVQPSPAFQRFFFSAIKDHVLANDRIDAAEAAWLRQVLVPGGAILHDGRAFLLQLGGEAKWVSPEFEELFEEFTKG